MLSAFWDPGGITKDAQSEQAITTDYVPVGSYSFEVEDASDYEDWRKNRSH